MKIFLSYASEDSGVAGEINGALTNEDHKVFFSGYDVHPGEGFDRKIRENIEQCDIFIFLISPDSVRKGKYTLSELGLAETKWEKPEGYIIPVLLRETPRPDIPASLTRLDFLTERGNLVADVAGAVAKIEKERFSRRVSPATRRLLLGSLGGLALGAIAGLYPVYACYLGWGGCFGERPSVSVVTVSCVPKERQEPNPVSTEESPRYASRAFVLVKGSFSKAVADDQIRRLEDSVGTKELTQQDLNSDPSRYKQIRARLPTQLEAAKSWRVLEQDVQGADVRFPLPKLDPDQNAHFFVEIDRKPGTGEVTLADDKLGIRELANLVLQEDARTEEDPEYVDIAEKVNRVTLNLFEGDIVCWDNENVSPTQ